MKITELNKSHISVQSLSMLCLNTPIGIETASWFDEESLLIRITDKYKQCISQPHDLTLIFNWMQKESIDCLLISGNGPVKGFLPQITKQDPIK